MKPRTATVGVQLRACRSSESSCTNGRRYPIPNQWGIVEVAMTIGFHRGERSILAVHPNTIRLMGILCLQEEKVEKVGRHGEGSNSSRHTCE